MLNRIKSLKMNNYSIESILFIALAVYGGTNLDFLGVKLPLAWTWLIIGGSLALYSQFGKDIFKASLGKMNGKNIVPIIVVVIVSYIIAFGTSIIGDALGFSIASNTALGNGDTKSKIINLILVSISLIGEEIITAAIAFPVFYILVKKMRTKKAWLIAALASSILFGLMHWHVYQGNLYQMLIPIGLGRLPFTWLWIKTDSIWGGIIAHVLYDLFLFIPMILASM